MLSWMFGREDPQPRDGGGRGRGNNTGRGGGDDNNNGRGGGGSGSGRRNNNNNNNSGRNNPHQRNASSPGVPPSNIHLGVMKCETNVSGLTGLDSTGGYSKRRRDERERGEDDNRRRYEEGERNLSPPPPPPPRPKYPLGPRRRSHSRSPDGNDRYDDDIELRRRSRHSNDPPHPPYEQHDGDYQRRSPSPSRKQRKQREGDSSRSDRKNRRHSPHRRRGQRDRDRRRNHRSRHSRREEGSVRRDRRRRRRSRRDRDRDRDRQPHGRNRLEENEGNNRDVFNDESSLTYIVSEDSDFANGENAAARSSQRGRNDADNNSGRREEDNSYKITPRKRRRDIEEDHRGVGSGSGKHRSGGRSHRRGRSQRRLRSSSAFSSYSYSPSSRSWSRGRYAAESGYPSLNHGPAGSSLSPVMRSRSSSKFSRSASNQRRRRRRRKGWKKPRHSRRRKRNRTDRRGRSRSSSSSSSASSSRSRSRSTSRQSREEYSSSESRSMNSRKRRRDDGSQNSYSSSSRSSKRAESKERQNDDRAGSAGQSDSSRDDTVGHFRGGPGTLVSDRYRIIQDVGMGTFGRVVECVDLRHARRSAGSSFSPRDGRDGGTSTAAIKIVRNVRRYYDSALIEGDICERVNREQRRRNKDLCARMLDRFSLPSGHYCLVFECLGRSLYDFLKMHEYRPFPMFCVRDFSRQLLDALDFLHGFGLIHTDLKPENILLCHNEETTYRSWDGSSQRVPVSTRVKVIDFGGATYDNEKKSSIINTRQYRAPEVILGWGWSYPSDLWSAGCIVAELYAGELLFATHDNPEHLALMERAVGPFRTELLDRSSSSLSRECFDSRGWHRIRGVLSPRSIEHVRKMLPIEQMVLEHDRPTGLGRLLRSLLTIDPKRRATAKEALMSPFFTQLG